MAVCEVCRERFSAQGPLGRHVALHTNFSRRVTDTRNLVATSILDLTAVRDRVRWGIKDALGRHTRPLHGNRVRASLVLSLDMLELEFLALFGNVDMFTLMYAKFNRRYSLHLVGREIVSVLTPVLGHDWDNADKDGSQEMVYVRSVNVDLDRHFPLDVSFSIARELYMEEPSPGAPLVPRTYGRGEFRMKFCATTTYRRAVQVAM